MSEVELARAVSGRFRKNVRTGKTGKAHKTGYFIAESIVFIRFPAPELQKH